jgi:peptidoglycan/LPS O-acetylase OafA/YrhL
MAKRLLQLNGLALFCAVVYHATGWGFTAMFFWADRFRPVSVPNFDQLGGLSYYGIRTIEQVVIFCIPAFLFVSGFFIAFATKRDQPTIQWSIIGSRIRILIIPYLLWSGLIMFSDFLLGGDFTPKRVLLNLVLGRTAAPYYYIPLLIQLYLLAPLIVFTGKRNWRVLLAVVLLIHLVIKTIIYLNLFEVPVVALDSLQWITASWFFPGNLLWFSVGVIAGLNIKPVKEFLHRTRWAALILGLLFIPIGMIEWEMILQNASEVWIAPKETFLDNIYTVFFIIAFLGFEGTKFPFSKQLADLGPKSYGVYLVHSPVLQYTARVIYHVLPVILGLQIIFQPILIAAGVSVPLVLMWLMNKSPARRYYQYVFG